MFWCGRDAMEHESSSRGHADALGVVLVGHGELVRLLPRGVQACSTEACACAHACRKHVRTKTVKVASSRAERVCMQRLSFVGTLQDVGDSPMPTVLRFSTSPTFMTTVLRCLVMPYAFKSSFFTCWWCWRWLVCTPDPPARRCRGACADSHQASAAAAASGTTTGNLVSSRWRPRQMERYSCERGAVARMQQNFRRTAAASRRCPLQPLRALAPSPRMRVGQRKQTGQCDQGPHVAAGELQHKLLLLGHCVWLEWQRGGSGGCATAQRAGGDDGDVGECMGLER